MLPKLDGSTIVTGNILLQGLIGWIPPGLLKSPSSNVR
jgi:hypothetical protein